MVGPGVAVKAHAPGLAPFCEPQPLLIIGSIPVAAVATTNDPRKLDVPDPISAIGETGEPVMVL